MAGIGRACRGLAAVVLVAVLAAACADGGRVTTEDAAPQPEPVPDAAEADDSAGEPDPGTANDEEDSEAASQEPLGIVVALPSEGAGGMSAQGRRTGEEVPADHALASTFGFIAVDPTGLWVGVAGPIQALDNACLNVSFKTAANEYPPAAQLTADLGGCPDYERARITPGDPRLYTNLALGDEHAARTVVPAVFAQPAATGTGVLAVRVEEFEAPDGERVDGFLVGVQELSMWMYVQRRETAEGVQWFQHHLLHFLGWNELLHYGANWGDGASGEEVIAAIDEKLEDLFQTDVAGVQIGGETGTVWFFVLADGDFDPPDDLRDVLEPMLTGSSGPR